MLQKYDYAFKYVMVGPSSVGKTSILKRFVDDEFDGNYIATLGVDFRFKSLKIDQNHIKLQIWDTAGQQRFQSITKSYYNNSQVFLLVYDVTNQSTFDKIINFWEGQCQYHSEHAKVYVFANKCDHIDNNINQQQINMLNNKKFTYFVVSAKTGKGIAQSIISITKQIIKIHPKIQQQKLSLILKQSTDYKINTNKNKCCLKQ